MQVRYECVPSLSDALLIPDDLIVLVCQSLSGTHRAATCYSQPKLCGSSTSLLCYFYPISCPDVFILLPGSSLVVSPFPLLLPHPHWQQKPGVGGCHRWRGKERGDMRVVLFQPACWHAYRTVRSDSTRCLRSRFQHYRTRTAPVICPERLSGRCDRLLHR